MDVKMKCLLNTRNALKKDSLCENFAIENIQFLVDKKV